MCHVTFFLSYFLDNCAEAFVAIAKKKHDLDIFLSTSLTILEAEYEPDPLIYLAP